MTEFTKRPNGLIVPTSINRRGFLAGTAALGLAAGLGATMAAGEAQANEPKRGGHLKLGLKGGAATDVLDPATYTASVLFVIGRLWGDTLVETDPQTGSALPSIATSWEPSADASVWTFKIRNDVSFHDGKK
ncbi:MAG TPA: ABC transporter substrate-binding protein, partial [Mycoplana sp.]|nr:ABC transporter substrate-binding protein [Mycoplana sp.]